MAEQQQPQCFTKNAFLAEVQRYDCLYNKGSKEFKNKYTKMNCWTKIGEVFGMTAVDAEAKFTNLRSAYTRFLRKKRNIPSGSAGDVMKKQESEFAAMEWLLPHIGSSRQTISNLARPMINTNLQVMTPSPDSLGFLDEIESLENEQLQLNDEAPDISTTDDLIPEAEVIADNNQDKPDETNNIKKKRLWSNANKKPSKGEIDKTLMQTAKCLEEHLKQSKGKQEPEEDDGASLFFKSLVPRFKRLPNKAKAYIRVEIEQLFFKAELNFPSVSNADSQLH